MKKYYHRTLKWFINRIGKRIYRKPLKCSCKDCQKTYVDIWNGATEVSYDFHANYLFMCHNSLGIKYYDKPVKEKYCKCIIKENWSDQNGCRKCGKPIKESNNE